MKFFPFKKKLILILALSLSNLFILTVVFSHSFSGDRNYQMFSKSDQSLMSQIKKQCETSFQKVIKGEQTSFICNARIKQKHKGADYELKTRFKVIKEGEKLKIINISEGVINGEKHLTEAKFCDNCIKEREFTDSSASNLTEFMKEISILAEDISLKAEESSKEAFEDYNDKNQAKALARQKEKNCEGVWDKETKSFQEFEDSEEVLKCRLTQMNGQGDLISTEKFYHDTLKKELWTLYEEGEEELLQETLTYLDDPYRHSLSMRSSVALLRNYTRWKENFDVLDSLKSKRHFIEGISKDVKYLTNFMTTEQSQQDIFYLDEGFDGLYRSINDTTINIEKARSNMIQPSINYDAVSKEVEGLH